MRNYRSNVAFIDLLFNLLVGFTSLFIIALLLINPVAEQGKIDPPVELMVTANWSSDSGNDVDMWMLGPDGRRVGYTSKDIGYIVLNRDDLGHTSDVSMINGKRVIIKENYEAMEIRGIVPGEYTVNVHLYRVHHWKQSEGIENYSETQDFEKIKVTLMDLKPFNKAVEVEVYLPTQYAEKTAFTFIVDEKGNIQNIDTDANVKFVNIGRPQDDPHS